MAIIYSYPPSGGILATDTLVGTSTVIVGGRTKNQTKSFSIGSLATFITTNVLTDYVPYTGATGNINIGNNSIYTIGGAKLWDDGTIEGTAFQFTGTSNSYINTSTSDSRSWTLPDESGTIALTSNLSVYVPYTGATQTVNLNTQDLCTIGNVGIGTASPDPAAILDLTSTTKGFLPPRMNTGEINAIVEPQNGLIIYNAETHQFYGFTNSDWKTFRMDII